jgi:hypothetical protein
MSNLIRKLPINKFYNPTPTEINVLNTLVPEKEEPSYTETFIISLITSFLIILVLYALIYYQQHTINSSTLIIIYLVITAILCTTNLLTKQIMKLISSIL